MKSSKIRMAIAITCIFASFQLNAKAGDISKAIQQHRMGTLIIETKPGARVQVEQIRHEFWFGAAISS